MARPVTIQQSLIRSFAPLVLIVAIAAFALLFFAGRFAVRTLSAALIEQTYERVQERLDGFFEPVLIEIDELAMDAEAGLLTPEVDRVSRERLFRVVSSVPHASLAIVADTTGREVTTQLNEDGTHWYRVSPDDQTRPVVVRFGRDGREFESVPGPEGYRSKERPWHVGAVEAGVGEVHWTEPYQFYTTKEYGITVSKMVEAPDGEQLIVAIDVLLSELDEFTRSLRLQKNGQAFLVDRDGRVLGLPASPEYDNPAVRERVMLQRVDSIGNRLLLDARNAYRAALERHEVAEWTRPFRFSSSGRAYWGQVSWREYPGGLVLTPAVIVSERDILGPIHTARLIAVGLGALAILWALWKCVRVASRFSDPIAALADESDRIIRGAQTIDHTPVSSPVFELAKLSSSQVEMRQAMRTLGKMERDLQVAREIQQALLPESVPQCDGWSLAGWNEPADETGGDIYDFAVSEESGEIFMMLADATGHGVGPAISAAQVRAMARIALRSGSDLATLMARLNSQLHQDLPPGRFITLWGGRLDAPAGVLTTFSAGQAPLLRYHAAEDRFEVFDADVMPLGVTDQFHDDTGGVRIELAAGDVYAVFSDGIFEARSPEGEQFGTERTQDALRAVRDGTALDAIEAVRLAVEKFTHGAPADDDRTGVVVKRDG